MRSIGTRAKRDRRRPSRWRTQSRGRTGAAACCEAPRSPEGRPRTRTEEYTLWLRRRRWSEGRVQGNTPNEERPIANCELSLSLTASAAGQQELSHRGRDIPAGGTWSNSRRALANRAAPPRAMRLATPNPSWRQAEPLPRPKRAPRRATRRDQGTACEEGGATLATRRVRLPTKNSSAAAQRLAAHLPPAVDPPYTARRPMRSIGTRAKRDRRRPCAPRTQSRGRSGAADCYGAPCPPEGRLGARTQKDTIWLRRRRGKRGRPKRPPRSRAPRRAKREPLPLPTTSAAGQQDRGIAAATSRPAATRSNSRRASADRAATPRTRRLATPSVA